MTTKIVPGVERKLKNRTSIPMTIRNSLTMAYRHLLLIRRDPGQLFDVIVQPILFTLLFTFLFGGAVSGNIKLSTNNYTRHHGPTALTATSAMGVQLREDMEKGVFNRFKSLPISHEAPLTGAAIADLLRYSIATSLVLVMGYILGFRWATIVCVVVVASGYSGCLVYQLDICSNGRHR